MIRKRSRVNIVHRVRRTKKKDSSTRRDSFDFEFAETKFSQRVNEQSDQKERNSDQRQKDQRERDRSRERERKKRSREKREK